MLLGRISPSSFGAAPIASSVPAPRIRRRGPRLPAIEPKSIIKLCIVRPPVPPPPKSARERARLQVDERRAQLLALGLQLFTDHTYDELSIDDIAGAAGISKGLLYHYFPSKRDYYVEVVRMAAGHLVERTAEAGVDASPDSLLHG